MCIPVRSFFVVVRQGTGKTLKRSATSCKTERPLPSASSTTTCTRLICSSKPRTRRATPRTGSSKSCAACVTRTAAPAGRWCARGTSASRSRARAASRAAWRRPLTRPAAWSGGNAAGACGACARESASRISTCRSRLGSGPRSSLPTARPGIRRKRRAGMRPRHRHRRHRRRLEGERAGLRDGPAVGGREGRRRRKRGRAGRGEVAPDVNCIDTLRLLLLLLCRKEKARNPIPKTTVFNTIRACTYNNR